MFKTALVSAAGLMCAQAKLEENRSVHVDYLIDNMHGRLFATQQETGKCQTSIFVIF